ncbi:hypothetical protein [Clostridium sp.]|uniref:hypothetical protein n=1 Tax=Clostridium sp. TaxID=1506 RepID=UPI0025C4686B|nr:hypothetical protein [Clostridium sp.]
MAIKWNIKLAKELFAKEGYTLLSNEYINSKTKMDYICPCGHKNSMNLINFSMGKRCPDCNGNKRHNYEEVKKFFEKEGYKLISTEYINANTKLDYICPNGHIHSITFNSFNHGVRCPECRNIKLNERMKKDIEEIRTLFLQEGYILLEKEYINAHQKLELQCPNGHNIYLSYDKFQQGVRCSKCNASKSERYIIQLLKEFNIKYEHQYRFKDCRDIQPLPFDFYLPNYNMCIEYDGEGHYLPIDFEGQGQESAEKQLKDRQKKDNIKTKYCLDHNIKLIRIPYWEQDNIENILKQELNLE